MVRFRHLRLFRRLHRPRLLSRGGSRGTGTGGLRRVRRRLPDAAAGRRRHGLSRRPLRPAHRAQRLGGGDGHADLPGRRPARLPFAGHRSTDPAHAAAHGPRSLGRRRIHHLLHLHGRAGGARPPRPDGRRRRVRRHDRHPAGIGDRRRAGGGDFDRPISRLGLAPAVPAGPGRRHHRLPGATQRSRRGGIRTDHPRHAAARRSPTSCAIMAGCWRDWPASPPSARSASISCSSTS